MLDVLRELFKDELDEKWDDGKKEGRNDERTEIISTTLSKGHTPEQIADFIGIPLEEILKVQASIFQASAGK